MSPKNVAYYELVFWKKFAPEFWVWLWLAGGEKWMMNIKVRLILLHSRRGRLGFFFVRFLHNAEHSLFNTKRKKKKSFALFLFIHLCNLTKETFFFRLGTIFPNAPKLIFVCRGSQTLLWWYLYVALASYLDEKVYFSP